MSTYAELGIRPLINASANITRIGGSVMPPEVMAAMTEAAKYHIDLEELQRAVGNKLAELTHNEAAYVSCGAAAGVALATAAVVAGADPQAIKQLPDTTGMKNEIIIQKSHRNGYDHAVQMIGVKIIEAGSDIETKPEDLENAINDQTAAIFWFQGAMTGRGDLPLETVIEIANAHNIPVLVDAADQVPPVENLWKYTQMGAALAIFSGGKDLCGPQASGLVVGRKSLIDAMRVNGNPNASIGRPMKVGKEEMVGLLTAVKLYLQRDHGARLAQNAEIVTGWCRELNQISGIHAEHVRINVAGQATSRAQVIIDADQAGMSRDDLVLALRNGSPSIEVLSSGADGIFVNPMTLRDGEAQIVLDRLLEILQARASA